VTGVPLAKMKLKQNLLIACIVRNGRIITPGGSDTIEPGDAVVVITTQHGLEDIRDILR
ncbi:MAG: Trk system potassium transporter TrkA, partial [Oscillospiraceae bacterium]|nr:Trk system potassium transporter TrkA [Oscillospiraceae bacterium]